MKNPIAAGLLMLMMLGILFWCITSLAWGIACWFDGRIPSPVPRRRGISERAATPLSVLVAMGMVSLSCSLMIVSLFQPEERVPATFNITSVVLLNAINLSVMFALLLTMTPSRFRDVGILTNEPRLDLLSAVWAAPLLLLAAGLTRASMSPFITPEDSHPLLKMLSDNPPASHLLLLYITAVVVAPVVEELIFRVVLQSALTRTLGPYFSIPIVAFLFAFIHGWPDMVPLLAVAFPLGLIYHYRRSWLAVGSLHALFNGVMLTAQLLMVTGFDAEKLQHPGHPAAVKAKADAEEAVSAPTDDAVPPNNSDDDAVPETSSDLSINEGS